MPQSSRDLEQLRKMMGMIVIVCEEFGFIVSEANTKIMCLCTKGIPETSAVFNTEEAGQVQTSLYTSGETSTTTPIYPSRSPGAYAMHSAAFGSTPFKLYDRPSAPLELEIRRLRAKVL